MKLGEKMSYLQGLIEGLDINDSTKEGKVLIKMTDVMSEMIACIGDLQTQVDELSELCDIIDADLGDVEDDFYEYDDFMDDDDIDEYLDFEDDELYEVCCPNCGDTVILDECMLEEGSIDCPKCGLNLEFDFNNIEVAESDAEEEE